jgi:hypothetical protein
VPLLARSERPLYAFRVAKIFRPDPSPAASMELNWSSARQRGPRPRGGSACVGAAPGGEVGAGDGGEEVAGGRSQQRAIAAHLCRGDDLISAAHLVVWPEPTCGCGLGRSDGGGDSQRRPSPAVLERELEMQLVDDKIYLKEPKNETEARFWFSNACTLSSCLIV